MFFFLTVPNVLTISRLILMPVVVYAMMARAWFIACIVFAVASMTDLVDGWAARLLGQTTTLGAWLDHTVDKIFILGSVAGFVYTMPPVSLPYWFVVVLCVREFLLMIGALLCVIYVPTFTATPTILGKITMGAYMLTVALYLIRNTGITMLSSMQYPCALVTVALLSASTIDYCYVYLVRGKTP
jgi:cardiolipin synthase